MFPIAPPSSSQVYFHVENDLMRGQDAFFSLVNGPDDFKCSKFNHLEMFEGKRVPDWRAIHFSHSALMDVNVGFNNIASYRPKFALRWNSLYRHKCLGDPMPGTQQEGGDPTPVADAVESEVETAAEVLAQEEEANDPETVEALEAMEEIEEAISSNEAMAEIEEAIAAQFEDAKAEVEAQMQYAAAVAEKDSEAKADAEYEAFYNDQGKPARILEVDEEATESDNALESEEPSATSDGGRALATIEDAAEEPAAAATPPIVEGYKPPPGSILERALAPEGPSVPAPEAPVVPLSEVLPGPPSGERALAVEEAPAGAADDLAPPVPSLPVPTI